MSEKRSRLLVKLAHQDARKWQKAKTKEAKQESASREKFLRLGLDLLKETTDDT